jgi:hypothetical protein
MRINEFLAKNFGASAVSHRLAVAGQLNDGGIARWLVTARSDAQYGRFRRKDKGSLGVAVILDISGHAPCDFAAK